ncbi:Cullin-associated nedd8-dissociated protein [Thalictrum thalictroides]|uniref:Cullin-associated nedd8-dissociated protein n=1 Tax=Thalictrum thalictroides TaxID=46969 RepID=A0A7J6X4D7_THATH|nr:Cullin-associated nedd8-dissociated protein [Thalictrum thalictroides]
MREADPNNVASIILSGGVGTQLFPLAQRRAKPAKELIMMVDLALFKHIVDDGLESGLDDHYDVKMPCHLILSKLAVKCSAAVLTVLDSVVNPLQKTVNHKSKQDAVKKKVHHNDDMI